MKERSVCLTFLSSVLQRIKLLTNQCNAVVDLLQEAISILQDTPLPAVAMVTQLTRGRRHEP